MAVRRKRLARSELGYYDVDIVHHLAVMATEFHPTWLSVLQDREDCLAFYRRHREQIEREWNCEANGHNAGRRPWPWWEDRGLEIPDEDDQEDVLRSLGELSTKEEDVLRRRREYEKKFRRFMDGLGPHPDDYKEER